MSRARRSPPTPSPSSCASAPSPSGPSPARPSSPVAGAGPQRRPQLTAALAGAVLSGLVALLLLGALGAGAEPSRILTMDRQLPDRVSPEGVAAPAAPRGLGRPESPSPRCRRPWMPPVAAAVVDPFRPPSSPYGPGNRGLEYDTEPGQQVVAVADGSVRFAGPVGGAPVVVIDHGGGLVSTYVQLLDRTVVRGQLVVGGDPVAAAAAGFHLTARLAGRYVDPAVLLERRCVVVRLVVPPAPGV